MLGIRQQVKRIVANLKQRKALCSYIMLAAIVVGVPLALLPLCILTIVSDNVAALIPALISLSGSFLTVLSVAPFRAFLDLCDRLMYLENIESQLEYMPADLRKLSKADQKRLRSINKKLEDFLSSLLVKA